MINVNNIYKYFGELQVLKGVSCDIKKGEKVVIIGASGSGKSTLLRCMNLLEKPTYGEVWIDNKLITPVDPYLHFEVIKESNTYKKMYELEKEKRKVILLPLRLQFIQYKLFGFFRKFLNIFFFNIH